MYLKKSVCSLSLLLLFATAACNNNEDESLALEAAGRPENPGRPDNPGQNRRSNNGSNVDDDAFASENATSRFLTQATFGAVEGDIETLTGDSASDWFMTELDKTASLNLPYVESYIAQARAKSDPLADFSALNAPGFSFWRNAIEGDDQLRQRMAFALSQILVISTDNVDLLEQPEGVAHYQDILTRNAFGNYRDLLEEVTFAPVMGMYLTYVQNRAGDPETGRVPDENYAREIMQLFTIGLVELTPEGEPVLDNQGRQVETYTNADITGLARVFTGLSLQDTNFFFFKPGITRDNITSPMQVFPQYHSDLPKSFLGETIPAGTDGQTSIDMALDILFNHQNTGPFLARQLIQRFITSNPSPEYVGRVADAFAQGSFDLPNGSTVGTGERGDLGATLAAVLFDVEARTIDIEPTSAFGKIREPILRFIQWARAFDVGTVTPEYTMSIWDTASQEELSQHPYRSPSVFNFYRPGYVAPGSESAAGGLAAPELQIVNASSVAGYANFITNYALEEARFSRGNAITTAEQAQASFRPDYSTEVTLSEDPAALVDRLDLLLSFGTMSSSTKNLIVDTITEIPLTDRFLPDYDGATLRVQVAVAMAMTSPDVIVQR